LLKYMLILPFISISLFAQQVITVPRSLVAVSKELPDAPVTQTLPVHPARHRTSHEMTKLAMTSQLNQTASAVNTLDSTRAKLVITTEVTSKLPSGSPFQARLSESISRGGQVVLPQGTLFEGHLETKRARRLMRPGSLFMTFDRVILPNGEVQPVNLHLVSSDSRAVKTDEEGRVHPALSKKRLAIQLGGTALSAKIADDLAEEAGGTAVGAGSARFVGMGAAATFFALQKGREVRLRPGDHLEIEFGRPGTNAPMEASRAQNGLGRGW
jgi:hypothetical protein